ncbi:four-carbon acid sugar kinase family protein [Streptomyces winkii]|uniref:four-carbon acid sugar kinase family protein n=1 Tax=Streptomyces winkii TaxID=3051178 RepID=UPI0028D0BFEC|nr:four-carbon acid sugar kinase family protein [Streptomyces sp. DSM 40971]
MAQILVVADDLTGGNATGALFARLGLHAVTVSDPAQVPRYADAVDVLVVDTGSRRFTSEESYEAVHAAAVAAAGDALVVKRVDTTLRGNPGRELDAVVDAVVQGGASTRDSTPVRVLAVPAFPDAGRTTVGGIHLVDGVPLTRTPVAHDLFTSVRHSRIASVIGEQSSLSTAEVPLDVVESGAGSVLEALRRPADVLICDATENDHLRTVAAAAARLTAEDGTRWISLDSGPFGAALAAELGIRPAGAAPRILAIVGSVTEATDEQLARTEKALGAHYIAIDPGDPAPEPARVVRELQSAARSGATVLGVRVAPRAVRDPGAAERILRCLADIAVQAVEALGPAGLYTSGGDVAAAVTGALGAEGFVIEAEVLPLAVAGHLAGGPHGGLPFATKGGLIGGPDAAVACLERLRAMRTRAVPVARETPGSRDGTGPPGSAGSSRAGGSPYDSTSTTGPNHPRAEEVSP